MSWCYLFKHFIILQFDFGPIVWLFFGSLVVLRGLNNKINNIHEGALRVIYQDKKFSFETLLKRDKFVSIHMKNHIYLAIEVVQVKNAILQKSLKKFLFFKKMKLTIYGVVIIEDGAIYKQRNMETKVFQIWGLKNGICCQGK